MSSLFRRHAHPDELDTDNELEPGIDDDLRLRTVRTAASTIAESIRSEQRAERRKNTRRQARTGSRFFHRNEKTKRRPSTSRPTPSPEEQQQQAVARTKPRRNVYVNMPLSQQELRPNGDPWVRYVRNKVRTSSESPVTFPRSVTC